MTKERGLSRALDTLAPFVSATDMLKLAMAVAVLAPACGGGVHECDQCATAWCEADKVVWCHCTEAPDGGLDESRLEVDCADRGARCVVASDGSQGGPTEALCLDACDSLGASRCVTGEELVCADYAPRGIATSPGCPSCPDPAGPHPDADGAPFPSAIYEGLMAWEATGKSCP